MVRKLKSKELTKISNAKQPTNDLYSEIGEKPSKKSQETTNSKTKVKNTWKDNLNPNSRVRQVVYYNEESLADLNSIPYTEGSDVIRLTHKSHSLILRQTSIEVARAVLNVYPRIKNYVESIVGYLITLAGKVYTITKANLEYYSFNQSLSSSVSRYQNPKYINQEERLNVFERVLDNIIKLNKLNLLIMDLSLKNIILSKNSSKISDLRKLRMSLDPKTIINSIKSFLSSIFNAGLITKEDITYLIAYYMGANESLCSSWYKQKFKKEGEDVEILEALEIEFTKPLLV